jgi:hypothetical protein
MGYIPWKFDFCHGEGPFDIVGGPWASDGFLGSGFSRESGGFLQRVIIIWVSNLHLLNHSRWSQEKEKLNMWDFSSLSLLFTEHI